MTPFDEAPKLAPFTLRGHNPDVLNTIANLSNDEVFTPPELANEMLDMLEKAWAEGNNGAHIWADHTVTFLDPFTKSGVFLREITARLVKGLEEWMPDLQQRVNHILTKQVFGIGITQLTSLLARRSVYCSKSATGKHSIVKSFDRDWGNIWFERTEHTWVGGTDKVVTTDENGNTVLKATNGRCKYCGASQKEYERSEALESHAYAFIHTDNIKARMAELFGEDMHFDVVIGNPPYQLSDGGFGISAQPIYHLFIEQAKALEPKFLALVVPSRWMAGGKGLDEFRSRMLSDARLREIVDFPDSNDVFPGTQIKGGVSYWLWSRDNPGLTNVKTISKGEVVSEMERPLREKGADVFIRYNLGVSILRKVLAVETNTPPTEVSFTLPSHLQFNRLVSSRRPFGFDTTFKGRNKVHLSDLILHRNGGKSFVGRDDVKSSRDVIDEWKVFIPRAGSGSDAFPHPILSKPFPGAPGEVCSETYIYIGPFADQAEVRNVISYLRTRLLRFLVLLHKPSQSTTREHYTFVPVQDFSKAWTDEELYAKYALSEEEICFIESMVRPMELENE